MARKKMSAKEKAAHADREKARRAAKKTQTADEKVATKAKKAASDKARRERKKAAKAAHEKAEKAGDAAPAAEPPGDAEPARKGLKLLSDHNDARLKHWRDPKSRRPTGNKIACPRCGEELNDCHPGQTLAGNPPRAEVRCSAEGCAWHGRRVA